MGKLTVHFENGDTEEYEGVERIKEVGSRYEVEFGDRNNSIHIQKSSVQLMNTGIPIYNRT
jgi:hypothetical protein